MDKLIIERSGPLVGTVEVSGAKNAALPIMAACLLTEDESVIEHVPQVMDVATMAEILRVLGAEVVWDDPSTPPPAWLCQAKPAGSLGMSPQTGRGVGSEAPGLPVPRLRSGRALSEVEGPGGLHGQLIIRPGPDTTWTAPYELVSLMRASICVLGPLLAKRGRAKVAMPGGCVIGSRPIDLHLKGLEALGASLSVDHGYIVAQADRLRGTTIHLAGPCGSSVLATANVMMAATLADGVTVIEHAAGEPEVVDLANYLNAMGARIAGHGSPLIRIEGVSRLHGARYRIIPDRIEAGTLMMAAAMLGGDVTIHGARSEHLGAVIDKLAEAHVSVEQLNGALRIRSDRRLNAVDVMTLPFPGFPTDLQAPFLAMMAVSQGVSVVTEKIYPERFMHVQELARMGAQISREGPSVVVKGVERLSGAPVMASDLRASAALVLAGLSADNCTELHGVEHLDRGYQHLEQKLARLGARIRRINSAAQ